MAAFDHPTITELLLGYKRDITIENFLRAAGYAPLPRGFATSPHVTAATSTGCQFFKDVTGRACVVLNSTSEAHESKLVQLVTGKGAHARVEHFRGPSYPESDFDRRLAVGFVSIHRPRVLVLRIQT